MFLGLIVWLLGPYNGLSPLSSIPHPLKSPGKISGGECEPSQRVGSGAGPASPRLCPHVSCLKFFSVPFSGDVELGRGRP